MILRMWTGWTARRNGDAYERYLREELFPRLQAEIGDRGYRGYQILRRDTDEESEFITLVWFDALECVTAFAGPGYLVAVGYMDPGNWATDIAGGARFGSSSRARR